MPFPDLQLKSDPAKGPGGTQQLFAEGTGVPDNGNNTFLIPFVAAGVNPAEVDPEKMKIFVDPDPTRANPGVTDARFVSLSPDRTQLTMSFVQSGAGDCTVVVQIQWSGSR
jgi:hypothetical protein